MFVAVCPSSDVVTRPVYNILSAVFYVGVINDFRLRFLSRARLRVVLLYLFTEFCAIL